MKVRTFSLGAGKDTVVFESIASANGKDEITGFTAGDKLNFKAFSSSIAVDNLNVASTAPASIADGKIYQTTVSGNISTKDYGNSSTFSELFAASGKAFTLTTTSGAKAVVAVKGDDVTQIYYVTEGNSDTTLANTDVVLVATIDNNGSGVTLETTSFA